MNRRSFLTSIFGGLGAVAVATALTPKSAEAASLLDELKAIDNGAENPADLPAEDAIETQAGNRGNRGGGNRGGGNRGGGNRGGGGGRNFGGGGNRGGGGGGRNFGGGGRNFGGRGPGWNRRPPVRTWRRAPVWRGPRRRCWWTRNSWGQMVRRCAYF